MILGHFFRPRALPKKKKYSLCRNFIVLFVKMAENLPKTRKNDEKIEKMPKKGVKIRILKNGFRFFSTWSNFDLNSKFQVALMFND